MPLGMTVCLAMVCSLFATACQRAVVASFVPRLQLQLSAQRSRNNIQAGQPRAPWDASVVAWLRFQPSIAAVSIPVRAEFEPELAVFPCEVEDLACLEEFAEGERAASQLQGQLE